MEVRSCRVFLIEIIICVSLQSQDPINFLLSEWKGEHIWAQSARWEGLEMRVRGRWRHDILGFSFRTVTLAAIRRMLQRRVGAEKPGKRRLWWFRGLGETEKDLNIDWMWGVRLVWRKHEGNYRHPRFNKSGGTELEDLNLRSKSQRVSGHFLKEVPLAEPWRIRRSSPSEQYAVAEAFNSQVSRGSCASLYGLPISWGSSSPLGFVLESGLKRSPYLGEALLVVMAEHKRGNGNMQALKLNWYQHTTICPGAIGQSKSYDQGQGQGAKRQGAELCL